MPVGVCNGVTVGVGVGVQVGVGAIIRSALLPRKVPTDRRVAGRWCALQSRDARSDGIGDNEVDLHAPISARVMNRRARGGGALVRPKNHFPVFTRLLYE